MENPMINYTSIIKETNSRHYNVADQFKDNSVEENVKICKNQCLSFSVGMINVTGELNIGMAIRSASLLGASKFYIFGRNKFDKRSTVGAEKYIDIIQYTYHDPINANERILDDIKQLNHPIFLCEQGGIELGTDRCRSEYIYASHSHPLFLFGSESHGIPQNILDYATNTMFPDYEFIKLSIPQRGVLRSFNVSAAMNIMIWDYLKEINY